MIENPGDVMDYIVIVAPLLFVVAAAVPALIRRWRIKAITQRRQQTQRAAQVRRLQLELTAVDPQLAGDGEASSVAEAFAEVDRRLEAAFAALDDFKAAQQPDGVSAHR